MPKRTRDGRPEFYGLTKEETIRRIADRNTSYHKWLDAQPKPKPARRQKSLAASNVTITKRDGTVVVAPAYSQAELRRIAPERESIPDGMRQRILHRDQGACRYCGNDTGPFHMDHVVPVAHGGPTNMRNLVTACATCNLRKGTDRWKPNPAPRSR